ncbi:MAG: hypothetical protein ACREFI_04120 [Stellaceae bacterium]
MSRRRWTFMLGLPLGVMIALSAHVARADAIDGSWCSAEGKRMQIEGPAITTPAGTQWHGNYSRHYFTYEVPASDPGAGQTVYMALQNENTVHITVAADAQAAQKSPVEVWHRCPPAVSLRSVQQPAG